MTEAPIELPADEYAGPALVSMSSVSTGSTTRGDGQVLEVDVTLRGHFEPLDGRFHWYGRIAADDALDALATGTTVTVTTPAGSADGRLSDIDPWGRFRVSGTGRPPF